MSDDFLSRWSRRKREVAETENPSATPPAAQADPAAPVHNEKTEEKPFDVSTLPPLESIDSLTDIKAFMQSGVPAELTRAALRRVWSADPAIRDFIGIAENQWDFTLPASAGGPPGFGPLDPAADISKMVADVFGEVGKVLDPGAEPSAVPSPAPAQEAAPVATRLSSPHDANVASAAQPETQGSAFPAEGPEASLHEGSEDPEAVPPAGPTHGSALPR